TAAIIRVTPPRRAITRVTRLVGKAFPRETKSATEVMQSLGFYDGHQSISHIAHREGAGEYAGVSDARRSHAQASLPALAAQFIELTDALADLAQLATTHAPQSVGFHPLHDDGAEAARCPAHLPGVLLHL